MCFLKWEEIWKKFFIYTWKKFVFTYFFFNFAAKL